MSNMFKLMEHELGVLYSHLKQTLVSTENIDTLASYIIENDNRSKYSTDEYNLVKNILKDIKTINSRIDIDSEKIEKIQSKIIDLHWE